MVEMVEKRVMIVGIGVSHFVLLLSICLRFVQSAARQSRSIDLVNKEKKKYVEKRRNFYVSRRVPNVPKSLVHLLRPVISCQSVWSSVSIWNEGREPRTENRRKRQRMLFFAADPAGIPAVFTLILRENFRSPSSSLFFVTGTRREEKRRV